MDSHTYEAILAWIIDASKATDLIPWRDNQGRLGLDLAAGSGRPVITFGPPVAAGSVCRLYLRGAGALEETK